MEEFQPDVSEKLKFGELKLIKTNGNYWHFQSIRILMQGTKSMFFPTIISRKQKF